MIFFLQQFKFYRKYKSGYWRKINTHITYGDFWVAANFKLCCGAKIVSEEYY